MPAFSDLTKGLNLWGFSAGVNMAPGQALDAQDVLYRGDGAFYKHWGYRRIQDTALANRIIAHKGFNYKGKNTTGAARPGNFGIADDGNDYTRRVAFYSSAIVLTDTELRFWNPVTETFDLPPDYYPFGGAPGSVNTWVPTGMVIDPSPKPTMLVLQNNVYIFGWANMNLRWDPVDRVLYEMGWDTTMALGNPAPAAGPSTLIVGATYQYRAAWIDLLTGEEGELGDVTEGVPTAANPSLLFAAGDFAAYGGVRHFYMHGAMAAPDLDNADVGIVLYRTEADRETFHFLTLVRPDDTPSPPCGGAGAGLATCTVTDNGLATDASIKGDVRVYYDLPDLNFATEFRSQLYGVSWNVGAVPVGPGGPAASSELTTPTRVYFNDFRKEKSFLERYDLRNYRELPLSEGEVITAVARTNTTMVVFSNSSAYKLDAVPNATTGGVQLSVQPLKWTVGCVGPKAWTYAGGWLYFLSDRGPYRWSPGMASPEWIGKNLLPLFLDTGSGLCQLNMAAKLESEVLYDQDADAVRFLFACGTSLLPNRHISYFVKASEMGDPTGGWVFHSPRAQAYDYTHAYAPLTGGGTPVTPFDRKERMIFSDPHGFLYEYNPDLQRAGLPPGFPATGIAQAPGSGLAVIVTPGGLYVAGDDMEGLRLEVVHLDGTIDVREVAANTATDITPDAVFSQDPTGATWYVGGIPAYWRSWVDSAGNPSSHKILRHLWLGYNREFVTDAQVINLSVSTSSDWPAVISRARTAALDVHRAQVLCSLTGRYFTYEFANTFPDQPFMISYFEPELEVLPGRRI